MTNRAALRQSDSFLSPYWMIKTLRGKAMNIWVLGYELMIASHLNTTKVIIQIIKAESSYDRGIIEPVKILGFTHGHEE